MATDKTTTARVVDFTNTKDGGAGFNKKRVPSGDYEAKITGCEDAPSKKDGVHQWLYSITLTSDKYSDRCFPYYCKLQENQLWKLRNLFLAAGITVPKKKIKLDPSRIVGKTIGITLDDDEYEGKAQSNVSATFPASELEDSDDGDEEDDDTEDEDEDDEEEEPAPPARKTAKKKPAPAPVDDEDEDEDEEDEADPDDEDDEEEEPPAPVARKKAAKPAKKAAAAIPGQRKKSPAVDEVDDDELEELDLEEI